MYVCIDIGNTSTSIGRWENGAVTRVAAIEGGVKDPAACEHALREAGAADAAAAILASVVPSVNDAWVWLLKRLFNLDLQILTHETPIPVGIDYPNKAQIGADRLADAVGAFTRHGAPVIVADFGTALTFDIVNARGDYTGGVIAPGIPLMTSYLHEKTAKLPLVELRGEFPVWGDSTENAMKLGARIGYRGMVREITSFIRERVGANVPASPNWREGRGERPASPNWHEGRGERPASPKNIPRVLTVNQQGSRDARPYRTAPLVATGGYAQWALEDSGIDCSIEPDLTLFGLGVILEHNKQRS